MNFHQKSFLRWSDKFVPKEDQENLRNELVLEDQKNQIKDLEREISKAQKEDHDGKG